MTKVATREAPSSRREDFTVGGLRPFPILGNSMDPTLRSGDFVLVAPIDGFDGEGLYVIDGPPQVFSVQRWDGGFQLISDNKTYPPQVVSRDYFVSHVLAKVVFTMNVVDGRRVPSELRV